jgi:hypothetical protein
VNGTDEIRPYTEDREGARHETVSKRQIGDGAFSSLARGFVDRGLHRSELLLILGGRYTK